MQLDLEVPIALDWVSVVTSITLSGRTSLPMEDKHDEQADNVVFWRDLSSQTVWKRLGGLSELNVLVLHLFNKVYKDSIFLVMRPQLS